MVIKEMISLRQLMFLFLTLIFSPSVRYIPNFTSKEAQQASWLTPIVAFTVWIPIIYMLHALYKKYPGLSFLEIIKKLVGTGAGKIIAGIYLVWVTILIALYTRYYAERLVSTILPNVNMLLFIVILLLTVAVILRQGIVIISRMNEIILPVIVVLFIIIFVFAIHDIKLERLSPISYLDFFPVMKASVGIIGLWSYFIFMFFFSDSVSDKDKIRKVCLQTTGILTMLTMILLVTAIGLLGSSTLEMIPIPYFAAVKQISVFNTLERIESFVVSLWILSDFILISVFTYIALNLMKFLFKLTDTKPLISMYLFIIYFLALSIWRNAFELQNFSNWIAIPVNILLGYLVPVLIFAIGFIRGKVAMRN